MKRLARIFLSIMIIAISSFSFVGCTEYEEYFKGTYYFNSEYTYRIDDPSNKVVNSTVYGDFYGTSVKFKDNKFIMENRFNDEVYETTYQLSKDSMLYLKKDVTKFKVNVLKAVRKDAILGDEEIDVSGVEIPEFTLDYSKEKGTVKVTAKLNTEEMLVLEFVEDTAEVVTHGYRLYNYNYKYTNNSVETVDDPSKKRFNDFIDIDEVNKEVTRYENGVEYKYSMTQNSSQNATNVYDLTLLTSSPNAFYETATLTKMSTGFKISFSKSNIALGTMTYKETRNLLSPIELPLDDLTYGEQYEKNVGLLASSTFGNFVGIVKIIFPIFIGVVLVFGLFYGIKLGVKYSKAENEEDKKKAKSNLIRVIIGCGIAIVVSTIIMIFI